MLTKDSKDYIKVEGLNRNIQTQIRNLCSGDFSNTTCVEDLPFYYFHINFKKNILEALLKEALSKKEIKQADIDKLLTVFDENKVKVSKIEDVSLVLFKLKNMENYSKFNMELFVAYTNRINKLLQKTSFKKIVAALCVVTSIDEITVEELGTNFENLEDILDEDNEPETFHWNELKGISLKTKKKFYYLNSEVEKGFYYSKGILPYPDDVNNDKKTKIDKNIFLDSYGKNQEAMEKELRAYYDSLYSVLTNRVIPLDLSLAIDVLANTFKMLLKMQFGSAVEDAMLEKSKTESGPLTLTGLGEYLGVHTATFGERLKNMYLSKIPDIEELYKISYRLDKTSDSLLGLEVQTDEDDYTFSKASVEQYIESKYGLDSETLAVLEAWQESLKVMGYFNGIVALNKGLNTLLKSKFVLRAPLKKNSSFFIKISDDQMEKLKGSYDKGIELKENTDIEGVVAAGYIEKSVDALTVRYNKKNLIIKEGEVKIVKTPTKEEYHFDDIMVQRKDSNPTHNVYRITQGNNNNIAFTEDKQGTFFDILLDRDRNLVIGREETDFLTPLLNYLGSDNTTFLTIDQRDLDTLHEGFNDGEYAVEDFYEEVSTNYGSLKFESDNLRLLEILTRLKNFKYDK